MLLTHHVRRDASRTLWTAGNASAIRNEDHNHHQHLDEGEPSVPEASRHENAPFLGERMSGCRESPPHYQKLYRIPAGVASAIASPGVARGGPDSFAIGVPKAQEAFAAF